MNIKKFEDVKIGDKAVDYNGTVGSVIATGNYEELKQYDSSGAMADCIKTTGDTEHLVAVSYMNDASAVWVYGHDGVVVEDEPITRAVFDKEIHKMYERINDMDDPKDICQDLKDEFESGIDDLERKVDDIDGIANEAKDLSDTADEKLQEVESNVSDARSELDTLTSTVNDINAELNKHLADESHSPGFSTSFKIGEIHFILEHIKTMTIRDNTVVISG